MVQYLFIQKKAYIPDLTHVTENDRIYGGIRFTYLIKMVYSFKVFGKNIIYYSKTIGTKTFLRPYKKYWDKKKYRLPYVYWGKQSHPLTRLWITLSSDSPIGSTKIIPEASLVHQTITIYGHTFKSKVIANYLNAKCTKFFIS